MTCLLCLYWKLVKITYFCTYLCTQNRRDFVSRGTSWIGKQQCKHNCKTYTFDSNLSCHIIKKNPIVYFVFNEARNNTKRYADCVCMLCFGAFDIWECRKVSPCVRNGGSRLCFNIYYICPPPPPPIPRDDSEILVVCEFNGPCTYFTTFIKCIWPFPSYSILPMAVKTSVNWSIVIAGP